MESKKSTPTQPQAVTMDTSAPVTMPARGAAAPRQDEGEPQTQYLHPGEGGAYTKQPDGSLVRESRATEVPETAPVDPEFIRAQDAVAKEAADRAAREQALQPVPIIDKAKE